MMSSLTNHGQSFKFSSSRVCHPVALLSASWVGLASLYRKCENHKNGKQTCFDPGCVECHGQITEIWMRLTEIVAFALNL